MSGIAVDDGKSFWDGLPFELLRPTPVDLRVSCALDRGPDVDANRAMPSPATVVAPARLLPR